MSNSFRIVLRSGDTGMTWMCFLASIFLFLHGAFAQSSLEDVHVTPRIELMAAENPRGAAYGVSGSSHPVIKTNVDLVLVPVTVTDLDQRLVTGLSQDNFQVFENKKRQVIKHFSSEDTPVSLGIIVDISGSMASKIERAREAVKQFCDSANLQDEFFLITFSDQPHLVHDFTNSPQDIEGSLLFAMPKGRTALLDAIYMGTRKMREAKYSKRALLIISDGGDNHSRYTERELKSAVKEADLLVYAIGIFDQYLPTPEERLGPELLSEIAETTGGRAFILDNLSEMPFLARRIGTELRTQYVLGYHPDTPLHDGKWHKITVKLKVPKHLPYLKARAKTGYYASNE